MKLGARCRSLSLAVARCRSLSLALVLHEIRVIVVLHENNLVDPIIVVLHENNLVDPIIVVLH